MMFLDNREDEPHPKMSKKLIIIASGTVEHCYESDEIIAIFVEFSGLITVYEVNMIK